MSLSRLQFHLTLPHHITASIEDSTTSSLTEKFSALSKLFNAFRPIQPSDPDYHRTMPFGILFPASTQLAQNPTLHTAEKDGP